MGSARAAEARWAERGVRFWGGGSLSAYQISDRMLTDPRSVALP